MKNIQYAILVSLGMLGSVAGLYAQGWDQDRNGIYSIGIGGTDVIALGGNAPYFSGSGLSVNVSGEYRVQRFIGVGFETGMDVLYAPYYRYPDEPPFVHTYASIGIPLGVKFNVHILEAANLPIANKLDAYAGLNLGGGPAFFTGPGAGVYGFLQAGPQIGVRYWFTPHIAAFGEFGWGATFANIGVTL